MNRCAACGYEREPWHEFGTDRCPPETADKNGRRGRFRPSPEPDLALWPEIIRRDVAARFAAIEAARVVHVPDPALPPQVSARPPYGPGEFASYQGRQAAGLGRAASAAGWTVRAWYWRAADGTEGCAVSMSRGDLRAVATWTRPPGKLGGTSGWATDAAYGWRLGTMPATINTTDLGRIFSGNS